MKLCIVVYTPESLYEGIRYFESALNLQIYYTLLKKKKNWMVSQVSYLMASFQYVNNVLQLVYFSVKSKYTWCGHLKKILITQKQSMFSNLYYIMTITYSMDHMIYELILFHWIRGILNDYSKGSGYKNCFCSIRNTSAPT